MADRAPTVSVIIPTYNRASLLLEALESVLAQTFQDFEVLIVDDGSTDDTAARLAPYLTDPRIRYLPQANRGPASARNHGVEQASGIYLAFLDSDDRWLPEKLKKQLTRFSARPDLLLVYTAVTWINREGAPLEVQPPLARRRYPTYYEDLLFENVIIGSDSAALVQAQALKAIPLYDSSLPTLEDQDLWLRLSVRGAFDYLDEPLVQLRAHGANLQHDPDGMAGGRRRFLEKRRQDILPEYRHHLPHVEYVLDRRTIFGYLLKRRYGAALRATAQLVVRQPLSVFHLIADGVQRGSRARSATWR